MTYCSVFVDGERQSRVIGVEVKREGSRISDVARIDLVSDRDYKIGQKVEVVMDKVNPQYVKALYSCERHYGDESGHGHHGHANGVRHSSGYAGQAWEFRGSGNVRILPSDDFDWTNKWDISLWINPSILSDQRIIHVSDNTDPAHRIIVDIAGGKIRLIYNTNLHTFDITPEADKWQFLRIAQLSSGTIKCWLDDDSEELTVPGYLEQIHGDIFFGQAVNDTLNYEGKMDIIRILCGGNMTASEHQLIRERIEAANYMKFGGVIRQSERNYENITKIEAFSWGAELNEADVVYQNLTSLDAVKAAEKVINDHTSLHATAVGLSGVVLDSYADGKVIENVERFLDATTFTFTSDALKNIYIFNAVNRVIHEPIIHGRGVIVESGDDTDENIVSDIILTTDSYQVLR